MIIDRVQVQAGATVEIDISVTEARAQLPELINQVHYGNSRIYLTRHGKRLVALVPAQDLEMVEKLEDTRRAATIDGIRARTESPSAQSRA